MFNCNRPQSTCVNLVCQWHCVRIYLQCFLAHSIPSSLAHLQNANEFGLEYDAIAKKSTRIIFIYSAVKRNETNQRGNTWKPLYELRLHHGCVMPVDAMIQLFFSSSSSICASDSKKLIYIVCALQRLPFQWPTNTQTTKDKACTKRKFQLLLFGSCAVAISIELCQTERGPTWTVTLWSTMKIFMMRII